MLSPKDLEFIFQLDQDPLGANPKGFIEIPEKYYSSSWDKVPDVMLLHFLFDVVAMLFFLPCLNIMQYVSYASYAFYI